MKNSLIKSALFYRRNIIALLASFIILRSTLPRLPIANLPMFPGNMYSPARFALYGLSVAIYLGFVVQSLLSAEFKENHERREMVSEIRKLNEECHQNARILNRKLELKAQQRLSGLMKESDEIVQAFLKGENNRVKERVVQQSLKLTAAYIKLADMFRIRAAASNSEKISQLARRINANIGVLNDARDRGVADELRRVIETDEKMIESLKNEKFELDKIDARLQYMESTMGMLKYNIISNMESDELLNRLESEINEAGALNDVLYERYGERREERRARA